jgi:hypothetical protein
MLAGEGGGRSGRGGAAVLRVVGCFFAGGFLASLLLLAPGSFFFGAVKRGVILD